MSTLPFPPQDGPDADEATDPAIARAEGRLRMLRELAEIGMALARALKPPADAPAEVAEEAEGKAAGRRDPAEVFAGLSRAIRLTLMLEARADEALRDLIAGVVRARRERRERAAERARAAADEARQTREARVRELVIEAAEDQIADPADLERLDRELEERLIIDEDYCADPERPLRQIVERLCDHFDIVPDWSRWDGEGWTPEAPAAWPWTPRFDGPRPPPPTPPRALNGAHDLE